MCGKSIRAVVEPCSRRSAGGAVVMVFLQTWRASIIPLVAVADLAHRHICGHARVRFFAEHAVALRSRAGDRIVVDDAIVVVENVERHIQLGETPIEATRKAMEEVSGPIIAIALVLCAVFVPTAFVSGLTGQFYRQFALTIAFSTVISAFNSLTLSPAWRHGCYCRTGAQGSRATPGRSRVRLVLSSVQRFFTRASVSYTSGVTGLRVAVAALVVYVGLIGLTVLGFSRVPNGFVPVQDRTISSHSRSFPTPPRSIAPKP